VPLPVLLRRLADLPADPALPQMGLLECDAAGAILTLKTLPGFGLNRRSPSCPLWPVFSALQAPMTPIVTDVVLPDPAETRFRCFAVSAPRLMPAFDAPVLLQATMLVMADPGQSTTPPVPVGTTCRICPRDGCAARREPSVIRGEHRGFMGKRVLLIEDEPNIIEAISFILSRDGWTVHTHEDGETALNKLRRTPPNMVILDVMLPGRSGFDILRDIRADAALAHIPVMMLTARGQTKDRELALRLGANHFMTKPFSNQDIRDHVRILMEKDGSDA